MAFETNENLMGENRPFKCNIFFSIPVIHFLVKLARTMDSILLLSSFLLVFLGFGFFWFFVFLVFLRSSEANGRKEQIFFLFFFLENRLKAATTSHASEMNFSMNFIVKMILIYKNKI